MKNCSIQEEIYDEKDNKQKGFGEDLK